jgi:lipopolysaccharide export system permease protein
VLFVLLLIFVSQQFIQIIGDAADGEVPTRLVSTLLLLNLPNMALLMLPISLFLAILFAHGRLYAESEMTVMHAVGFSHVSSWAAPGAGLADRRRRGVQHRLGRPQAKEREYQVIDEFKADPGISSCRPAASWSSTRRLVAYIQDLNDKGRSCRKSSCCNGPRVAHPVSGGGQRGAGDRRQQRLAVADPEGWLALRGAFHRQAVPGLRSSVEYSLVIRQQEMERSSRRRPSRPWHCSAPRTTS